ncbi:MAG: GGDEF domain-containing protein, partial [bacterium]|nr:GGDEF domain-containing protein [bacterium]
SVSRQHAKIQHRIDESGDYYEVVDLGSVNGIRVNNLSVESARLRDGDRIQLGDVVFKFTVQDDVETQFHREVHRRIHYDQLTGLLTLTSFYQHLEAEMRQSTEDAVFTLAMTDLDGLKRVNDTYGHLAGAMVVEQMGVMIRGVLRPEDRGGLYGGDETILLFPRTHLAEAREVAERLRATIESRVFEHRGAQFGVTISQGLAEWPRDGDSLQEIVAAADKALYAAKDAGRNCVRYSGEPT